MGQHEYVCQSCFHQKICPEYHPQTYSCVHHVDEADVVPRADYEAVIAGQETLQKYIAKIKAEVAREIFEVLDRMMLDGAIGGKYPAKVINPDKFSELKKKYTGDQP